MSRANGVYEIPRKFSGENRYLKIFTTKGLIYFLSSGLIWIFLTKSMSWIGFILGALITSILVILGMFKIPERLYLYGGGCELDVIIFRVVKRKILKVIYTKALIK